MPNPQGTEASTRGLLRAWLLLALFVALPCMLLFLLYGWTQWQHGDWKRAMARASREAAAVPHTPAKSLALSRAIGQGLSRTVVNYRLEHYTWPDSLDSLIEAGLLDSMPHNPYSGQPMRQVGLDAASPGDVSYYTCPPDKLRDESDTYLLIVHGANAGTDKEKLLLPTDRETDPNHVVAFWDGFFAICVKTSEGAYSTIKPEQLLLLNGVTQPVVTIAGW